MEQGTLRTMQFPRRGEDKCQCARAETVAVLIRLLERWAAEILLTINCGFDTSWLAYVKMNVDAGVRYVLNDISRSATLPFFDATNQLLQPVYDINPAPEAMTRTRLELARYVNLQGIKRMAAALNGLAHFHGDQGGPRIYYNAAQISEIQKLGRRLDDDGDHLLRYYNDCDKANRGAPFTKFHIYKTSRFLPPFVRYDVSIAYFLNPPYERRRQPASPEIFSTLSLHHDPQVPSALLDPTMWDLSLFEEAEPRKRAASSSDDDEPQLPPMLRDTDIY